MERRTGSVEFCALREACYIYICFRSVSEHLLLKKAKVSILDRRSILITVGRRKANGIIKRFLRVQTFAIHITAYYSKKRSAVR